MQIMFFVFMFVIGCAFGSFLCCQVRRAPETFKKSDKRPARSVCLHCHKKLKWYDNIPIISWLVLKGRCRFCRKKIGLAELLSEILTGLSFLLLATTVNAETASVLEWAKLITMAIFLLVLAYLAIYDGLYGELPTVFLVLLFVCSIVTLIPSFLSTFSIEPFVAALLYGGLYLVLYLVSKGKWVGDGDWIIALSIGLALGSPWLALVSLFVANLLACLVMAPLIKKLKNHQIYFGPFLAVSFIVVYALKDVLSSLVVF